MFRSVASIGIDFCFVSNANWAKLNRIDIPFQIINLNDAHISKIQYHVHGGLSIVTAQCVWMDGELDVYARVFCMLQFGSDMLDLLGTAAVASTKDIQHNMNSIRFDSISMLSF